MPSTLKIILDVVSEYGNVIKIIFKIENITKTDN